MCRSIKRRCRATRTAKSLLLVASAVPANDRNGKGKAHSHRHNSERQEGRDFPSLDEFTGRLRSFGVNQLGKSHAILAITGRKSVSQADPQQDVEGNDHSAACIGHRLESQPILWREDENGVSRLDHG